ncbi:MAG: YggT family protein [Clostridia bacterium]|nr:YggT family protein [Clostridia bacterium]
MLLLMRILRMALLVYELLLIAYVLLNWLKPAANRWTELLRRVTEPVLTPLRVAIVSRLPARYQPIDWSPVAALAICEIIGWILGRIAAIFA